MLLNNLIKQLKRNNVFKYVYYKIFNPKLSFLNEDISRHYLINRTATPWLNYNTSAFDEKINSLFNEWSKITEKEYLIHYPKPGIAEPYYGWIVVNKNKVIAESLPYGGLEKTPLPHYIFYQRKKTIKVEKAVSVRYNWFNYWHFYNDVLGQFYLLDKSGFDQSIPVIVPAKALGLPYVKAFFETDYAKKRKWIFQNEDTFISLQSVYLCKSIPNIKDHFMYAANIFKKDIYIKYADKKIFITRNPKRGRFLKNAEQIIFLMSKNGFEIVDCDELSVQQQIEVFASAKIIAGIHGAGLTNIIYRYPHACTLIEIFPPDNTPTHYYWLAKELGFAYHAILGHDLSEGAFRADENELIEAINSI